MARPKLHLTDAARIEARRASWTAYKRRVRGISTPTAAPAGITWVSNETLASILTDVRVHLQAERGRPLLRGGSFLYLGRPAGPELPSQASSLAVHLASARVPQQRERGKPGDHHGSAAAQHHGSAKNRQHAPRCTGS